VLNDALGCAAEKCPLIASIAVRGDDDQVRFQLLRRRADFFVSATFGRIVNFDLAGRGEFQGDGLQSF
jgi:hypothetical protein